LRLPSTATPFVLQVSSPLFVANTLFVLDVILPINEEAFPQLLQVTHWKPLAHSLVTSDLPSR
jgi:hypothetical protein